MNQSDSALDVIQRDMTVLNDRFQDVQRVLDALVRYAPSEDVRTYAQGGQRTLELAVNDARELFGSLTTTVQVLKQQRDEAIDEMEYAVDAVVDEAYDEGYRAAMEDGDVGNDDLNDAYLEGVADETSRVEEQLGMTVEEAQQRIEEADQALSEWERWAKDVAA